MSVLTLPHNPFRLQITPDEAIAHKGWRKAGHRAMAELLAGPGLVVVLGEPGTGKTLLLRDLERRLIALGREVRFVTRGDPPPLAGARFVLIDEARMASDAIAAALLLPDMHCILADLPAFEAQVSALGRRATIVRLAPLAPKEARAFVASRIAQASGAPDLLTPDALDRLVKAGNGVPRALCVLGATALHFARVDASPQVTGEHVARALALNFPQAPPPDPAASDPVADTGSARVGPAVIPEGVRTRRRVLAAALVLILLTGAAWSVVRYHRHGVDTAASVASSVPASALPAVAERTDPVPPQAAPAEAPALPDSAAAGTAANPVDPAQPGAALLALQTPAHDGQTAGPAAAQPASPSGAASAPSSPPASAQGVTGPNATSPAASAAAGLAQSATVPAILVPATPPTPTHIVISYPRGGDADAVAVSGPAATLASRLRLAGYLVGDPVPVARSFVSSGLYAFFAEDMAAAAELHTELGPAAPEAEMITLPPGSSLPRPGTIEIMVPAGAPVDAWSQALAASAAPSAAEPATDIAGAAQPTLPTDNSTIGPAGTAVLSWSEPAEHVLYFVEVQALDGGPPHEVFAAYVDHSPLQIALDPASHHYAWRIHTVADAGGHYRLGHWSHFAVMSVGSSPDTPPASPANETRP